MTITPGQQREQEYQEGLVLQLQQAAERYYLYKDKRGGRLRLEVSLALQEHPSQKNQRRAKRLLTLTERRLRILRMTYADYERA